MQKVLQLAMRLGARLANPGEFTLRAFLNGRIDLSQAESVLDIVHARTDASLRLAVQGLNGRLSKPISELRAQLMQLLAYLTARIDFPEDEVDTQLVIDPSEVLASAEQRLCHLIASADVGMVYRQGVRTAIVGRPNVGKSSLLNKLLGEDRAIVTPVPGTTRDTLEETLNVKGIPFVLVDTAGIRDSADVVEHLGIERTRAAIQHADLVLLVLDTSSPLTPADRQLLKELGARQGILVANKCDLPSEAGLPEIAWPVVRVSALTGQHIPELLDCMAATALGGKAIPSDTVLVTNPRHKAALERALSHLQSARHAHAGAVPDDFISIDITATLNALGEITGQTVSEELLDTIFSQFCIGK